MKLPINTLRTAELVLPGHPDKLADAIADAIVEEARTREERALVGVEVALHRNVVFIDGRVACRDAETINFKQIVRNVYASAGYGLRFAPRPTRIQVKTDLCVGPLWPGEAEFREVADDQSIVTGYACSTPGTGYLPVEQALVQALGRSLYTLAHKNPDLELGPDGKLIVTLEEHEGDSARHGRSPDPLARPGNRWHLREISASIQHSAHWNQIIARRAVHECLQDAAQRFAALVPGLTVSKNLSLLLNAAGDFVEGGPHGDNGLSGKKLVVDFYGPRVPIGGGALSGKDFWKVDRAGALIAREVAMMAVQRLGCREATVTLMIAPGDRAFTLARVTDGENQHIDAARLSEWVDLRLCSKGNWGAGRAGGLVEVARWGHFSEAFAGAESSVA